MNQTIWKFRVPMAGPTTIDLPVGARILCVQAQHEGAEDVDIEVWALVDPEAARERRRFLIVGTGQLFDPTRLIYLGTTQHLRGTLVFHTFEVAHDRSPV